MRIDKNTIVILVAFLILPALLRAELSADAKARLAALRKEAPVELAAEKSKEPLASLVAATPAAQTAPPAAAKRTIDVVQMKNGDVLSGKLVEMFGGVLVFKAYGNDVKLPWKDIVSLETVDEYRFALSEGGALDGVVEKGERGKFLLKTQVGTVTAHCDDVKSIDNFPAIARKEKEKADKARFDLGKMWSGHFSVGLADTTGNSESRNTNLSAEATRKSPQDKLFLDGHFNRTKAGGITSADAIRGGMRLDVNITKNRFYFLFGRMEVDKIKELDMRSTVGAGLGNVFYDHKRGHLDMGFGITYVRDTYENAPKDSDRTFLYSLNWDRKISRALSFKERLLVYPNLADFADYRIEADTKFDYSLGNSLYMSLGFTNRYDSEPLPGKEEHDLTVTTSITKKY